jgi:PKD repeat protein
MTIECKLPHLPRTATEGDEVCDKYGNRWRFDAEGDGWISRGALVAQGGVTETKDGLVTPDILARLNKLRTYIGANPNPAPLKIVPGTDAYWYYFKSSDKFIRFRPEAEDTLRVEVDKGRIFQVLMRDVCPGARGARGAQGKRGKAGLPGPAEVCFQPSLDGDRLDFAIYTPIQLTLEQSEIELPNDHVPDVSVRLYKVYQPVEVPEVQKVVGKLTAKRLAQKNRSKVELFDQLQHLAIYYHSLDGVMPDFQKTRDLLAKQSMGAKQDVPDGLVLSPVLAVPFGSEIPATPLITVLVDPTGASAVRIVADENYKVDSVKSTAVYDPVISIVYGSVYLEGGKHWDGLWCAKSRQKGPDGVFGNPGESGVRVIECTLDSTSIVATCPIINVRLDCDKRSLFTMCSDIISSICVQYVKVSSDAGALSDKVGLDAVFASAQMILDDCKRVYRYKVVLKDDVFDDLNLQHWDPQPGCVTKRWYDRHIFNWMDNTRVGTCATPASTWWDQELGGRDAAYPNSILFADKPAKDNCCQDDFFYCPNIQISGCTDTGTPGAQAPPAAPAPPTPPPVPPPVAPPPPGGVLTADFAFAPLRPQPNQTVDFTNQAQGGTQPYSFSWRFGDGGTSTQANPTHAFKNAGTFRVTLTVTDFDGGQVTVSHNVVVGGGAPPTPPPTPPTPPPPTPPGPPPPPPVGECCNESDLPESGSLEIYRPNDPSWVGTVQTTLVKTGTALYESTNITVDCGHGTVQYAFRILCTNGQWVVRVLNESGTVVNTIQIQTVSCNPFQLSSSGLNSWLFGLSANCDDGPYDDVILVFGPVSNQPPPPPPLDVCLRGTYEVCTIFKTPQGQVLNPVVGSYTGAGPGAGSGTTNQLSWTTNSTMCLNSPKTELFWVVCVSGEWRLMDTANINILAVGERVVDGYPAHIKFSGPNVTNYWSCGGGHDLELHAVMTNGGCGSVGPFKLQDGAKKQDVPENLREIKSRKWRT